MGGFISIVYVLFSVVPLYYNNKLSDRKFIKKMYFIEDGSKDKYSKSGDSKLS